MWLESHGNLARHPKTRRLMQRMGWALPHTIGNLHLLWWWALEYAPTGDLTRFEPDQITYDLDLGNATPTEFLEAMIGAGFMDREESGTLRIHDWPDYTAKSLRPRFRRDPERWHNVLRSYGRPIPVPRRRRASNYASRNDQMVGLALRAGRRISTVASIEDTASTGSEAPLASRSDVGVVQAVPKVVQADSSPPAGKLSTPDLSQNTDGTFPNQSPSIQCDLSLIPKCLAGRRNFNGWWLKLQEQYKNKGCPMTAPEQVKLLALLARNPFTAVEKLQYSVVNFEKSYATLLAPQEKQSTNTS